MYSVTISSGLMQLLVLMTLWFGIDKFKNIFGQIAARIFMVLLVLLACTSLYFSYVRP